MSKVASSKRQKSRKNDAMSDDHEASQLQTLQPPTQLDMHMGSDEIENVLADAGFISADKSKRKKKKTQDNDETHKPTVQWSTDNKLPPAPPAPRKKKDIPAPSSAAKATAPPPQLVSKNPHLKVEREIIAPNVLGEQVVKLRSKKERLRLKKEALLHHLSSMPNQKTSTSKQKQDDKSKQMKSALSSFSSEFSEALNSLEDIASLNDGNTALEHLTKKQQDDLLSFSHSAQWKPTKKNLKSVQDDRAKFEQVMQHQAFQANPLSALQQHLHNQMTIIKHVQNADEEKQMKKKKTQQLKEKAASRQAEQQTSHAVRAKVKAHKKF